MLLSFSVQNFRCFADEATLSLTSSKLNTNVPRKGRRWVDFTERVAAIYGANAAGKTTVLEAIWAVAQAIRRPGFGSIYQPTADSDGKRLITYGIDFVEEDVRYVYELKAAPWGISYEALYSYPKGSRRTLFIREQASQESQLRFEKGPSLVGPTAEVLKITRPTQLFLSTAYKYGHVSLAPVARSLASELGVNFITFRERQDEQVLERVLLEMVDSPDHQVDLVSALLRAADLGISKVEVRKEEIPPEVAERFRRVIEALRDGDEPLEEGSIPRLKEVILFEHRGEKGEVFSLPMPKESAGTITWLTTAWHALNALREGSILLVDELDASLHPGLARYLVKLFLMPQLNIHGAQLIFTTHDVSLLGNAPVRLLEPQNVWFVEKDESGHSELFSLDDFDNRAGNNSERRYLAGQFGAIPDIDDALLLQYIATEPADREPAVA